MNDNKELVLAIKFVTIGLGIVLGYVLHAGDTVIDDTKLAMKMYSNQRAWKVGDLVTVIIKESTSAVKKEEHSAKKESKADAEAPIFGANPAASHHWLSNRLAKHVDIPSYKIKASSSFTGSGALKSSETLETKLAARVVDILENGVLVIRGSRRIIIKNESVNLIVTGLVRPRDIDADNSVKSTQIADAHIYYENTGDVTRGSRPGWVWRFFQYLNPF